MNKRYAIFFTQIGDGLNAKFLTSIKNPSEGAILPNNLGNGYFLLGETEDTRGDSDYDTLTWFAPLWNANINLK